MQITRIDHFFYARLFLEFLAQLIYVAYFYFMQESLAILEYYSYNNVIL